MDLHAWITQQVDTVEAAARARLVGRPVTLAASGSGDIITGTITKVGDASDGLRFTVARYGVEPVDPRPAPVDLVSVVLRRCEADRRILARHHRDPDCLAWAACKGCGNDDWGLPNVDNLNDCPELLDLAHAHGIKPEILAGLDQPQMPEQPKREPHPGGILGTLRDSFDRALTLPITTSDVPEALRGPHWKP